MSSKGAVAGEAVRFGMASVAVRFSMAGVAVRFSMAGVAVRFGMASVVAVVAGAVLSVGFRCVRLAIDVKGTRWLILLRLWIMNEASVARCLILWSIRVASVARRLLMNVASVARRPLIVYETTLARRLGGASVTCSIVVVDAVGSLVCIGVAMVMGG